VLEEFEIKEKQMTKRKAYLVASSFKINRQYVLHLSKAKILVLSQARLVDKDKSEIPTPTIKVIRYSLRPLPGKYVAILGARTVEGEIVTCEVKIIVRDKSKVFVFFLLGVLALGVILYQI